MSDINIAICGDRRVLPGMAVTVRSALENCSTKISIYVIADRLNSTDKERLLTSWQHRNCESVQFSDISAKLIKPFRSTAYLKSKAAYARFFIPEMFPYVQKCLYLDSDLLVCRDISELFHLRLGTNICAAVRDVSARTTPKNPELKHRLNLLDEANYFNSGVLYIDYDSWRSEHLTEALVKIGKEQFDKLHSQDQDALNVALEGRTLLLDTCWNISQFEKPMPLSGNIVHLIGTIKPWHARYRFTVFRYDEYYSEVIFKAFLDYASRTAYRKAVATSRLSAAREAIYAKLPTSDMAIGKARRALKLRLNAKLD